MSIHVREVTKRFGNYVALDRVTLEVPAGHLVALLGPSGSGKTTLLRIIAGLEFPDGGTVHYHEDDVTHREARKREVGFVFQHYALFRHMDVFENVAFGMRVRGRPRDEVRDRVQELLHLVRLDGLERRYPSELSGGQRQRVALARALAVQPKVLLLDEPFGALDAKVRKELRQWLRKLHDEIGVTSLFVTHDQEEAFEVADRVVVMGAGKIEQEGTPQEVFDQPANAFVMDFLGNVNVFHGRVRGGRARLGSIEVDCPDYPHDEDRAARVYVRPHELDIDHHADGEPSIRARVVHASPAGSVARLQLQALDMDAVINVDLPSGRYAELGLKTGDTVHVLPRRVRVFAPPDYSI